MQKDSCSGILPDLPGVREELRRYYDEVRRMDGEFQLVLDIVQKRAGLDNTIVMFAGDNGCPFPHGKARYTTPVSTYRSSCDGPENKPGSDLRRTDLRRGLHANRTGSGRHPASEGMTGISFLSRLLGSDIWPPVRVCPAPHTRQPAVPRGHNNTDVPSPRMARTKRHKLI